MLEGVVALPKSGTKPQQTCAGGEQAKALAAPHISFPPAHCQRVHASCEPCPWEHRFLGEATTRLSSAVTHIGQGGAEGDAIKSHLTPAGACEPKAHVPGDGALGRGVDDK